MSKAALSPVQQYLEELHARFGAPTTGNVASYIPELALADPARFGICIGAVDGHLYEVRDTRLGRNFRPAGCARTIRWGFATGLYDVA